MALSEPIMALTDAIASAAMAKNDFILSGRESGKGLEGV
jgi:hypothetical protein